VWGPNLGFIRAVDDGVDHLIQLGARQIIVTHADLPRPERLLDVTEDGVVTLVPDRRRDGTNVMAFPDTARLRASYGGGSFRRHLHQAMEGACPVEVRCDRDLSLDLDVLDDLDHPLIREVLPSWLPMSPASPLR
jgi:2-phospho-L-lactate guanylyltransferase